MIQILNTNAAIRIGGIFNAALIVICGAALCMLAPKSLGDVYAPPFGSVSSSTTGFNTRDATYCGLQSDDRFDYHLIKVTPGAQGIAFEYVSLSMLGGACYAPVVGGGWIADSDVQPVEVTYFEDYPNACDSGSFPFVRFRFATPVTFGTNTATLYVRLPRGYPAGFLLVSVNNAHPSPYSGWGGTYANTIIDDLPRLIERPTSSHICSFATTSVSTTAAGSGPFTYQWQWQPAGAGTAWEALAAGDNADVIGVPVINAANVDAPTLEARPLAGYINFAPRAFRCIVTNACGSVTSNPATLTIVQPCGLADVADDSAQTTRCGNGAIGPEDIEAFVNGFIADNAAIADIASDSADTEYNPNGSVGPEDLEAFVNSYIAGC